jgi:hypothetical protein
MRNYLAYSKLGLLCSLIASVYAQPAKDPVSLSPSSLSFGSQTVGSSATLTIKITNNQKTALTFAGFVAGGDFSVAASSTCSTGAPLGSAKTCNIDVRFTPTAMGVRTGTLTITDDAPTSPQTAALSGSGVVNLTLAPATLNFGSVALANTSPPQTVTLTNNSTLAIAISNIGITGDFAQSNTCGSNLPASSNCAVNVTFAPTATGTRAGTLTVTDGATNSPQTVSLTGTGVTPPLTLSATSLTFARQLVGTRSTSQTITITNNSGSTIRNIAVTENVTDFGVSWNCPATLKNGESCSVSVNSIPIAAGVRTGTLVITDSTNIPQTISLSGIASAVTSISVTPFNPLIGVGMRQQFTATAACSDNTVQDITSLATWTSSATSVATIGTGGVATAAGTGSATISATFTSITGSATLAVYQAFTSQSSMSVARYAHTATVLNNGTILIAGGYNTASSATAELYNPTTGVFSSVGSMATARHNHTATLLNNGMVLIAGGINSATGNLASAELYNPSTTTFTPAGNMSAQRAYATATLLNSGLVLIAGGTTGSVIQSSADLYNPVTNTFTATGAMTTARDAHTATLLNNGMVLVAGGNTPNVSGLAELYNPAIGTFTATGGLAQPRASHSATLLNNGTVLVAGGNDSSAAAIASAEIYDPAAGTFSAAGSMATGRYSQAATLLTSGMVLLAGGSSNISGTLASTELFDPASRTFTPGGSMTTARSAHTASLLATGGCFWPEALTPPSRISLRRSSSSRPASHRPAWFPSR